MIEYALYGLTEPGKPLREFVRYVGYCKGTLVGRLKSHIHDAVKHNTSHKHKWLRKLAREKTQPEIILLQDQIFSEEAAKALECFMIKLWKVSHRLVNNTDGGDGMANPPPHIRRRIGRASSIRARNRTKHPAQGLVHTEETRQKISAALLASPTWRKNHRRAMKKFRGVPKSAEHRRKIGAANSGKVRSPETIARMSENNKGKQNWLGREHSKEAKAKMSVARTGMRQITNGSVSKMLKAEEQLPEGWQFSRKVKILVGVQGFTGRQHSEETKAKMSAARLDNSYASANRGKPKSPEHRAAISAALKARAVARNNVAA